MVLAVGFIGVTDTWTNAISSPSSPVNKVAVITATKLNLRPAPSTGKPPVKQLESGSTVVILAQQGNWLKVSHNGDIGYIASDDRYIYVVDNDFESEHPPNIETLRQRRTQISAEMEKQASKKRHQENTETQIIDELDRIDRELNLACRRINRLHAEITDIETRLNQTGTDIDRLKHEIGENRRYIGQRLTALYKLGQLGMIHLLASAASLTEALNRQTLIKRILDADLTYRQQLLVQKKQLMELEDLLRQQKTTQQSLERDYQQQAARMTAEKQNRMALLEQIRNRKSIREAILRQLHEAARHLDETMNRLLNAAAAVSPEEKLKISKSFSYYKGLLKMPVKGKIVTPFGPDKRNNTITFNSGIEILAERGEPIHAVRDGTVQFSHWLKGYGNLIIIRHDNDYYTLYAHADELFKLQGDTVETGEVIATVGDTHSIEGPRLHFEVRHHSKALDPMEWLDQNG